ncbi:glycerophosphodiester phosphodiesterase family protein [Companilactobacillus sp. DQM5]|uniref:glycerophosphodiester phosphodiesterase family protein n=1 Tax=Companilactobacillus sp. DQM5 TaxID=3463359 RepID=UPI0040596850
MKTIFAHRGISSLAPENTMAAFNKTADIGDGWLETDVSITKDGQIFILHDDLLDRTTNLTGLITEKNSDEVASADAGFWFGEKYKNERIPTLEDVINFANTNNINLNIELKSVVSKNSNELADILVDELSKQIKRLNSNIELLISSFNPIMLLKMQKYNPDLDYACLFEDETLGDDWSLYMQACHSKAINVEDKGLTRQKIKQFKSFGYEVNVWTVDSKVRANELFNWGVDGIFTNKAHELKLIK